MKTSNYYCCWCAFRFISWIIIFKSAIKLNQHLKIEYNNRCLMRLSFYIAHCWYRRNSGQKKKLLIIFTHKIHQTQSTLSKEVYWQFQLDYSLQWKLMVCLFLSLFCVFVLGRGVQQAIACLNNNSNQCVWNNFSVPIWSSSSSYMCVSSVSWERTHHIDTFMTAINEFPHRRPNQCNSLYHFPPPRSPQNINKTQKYQIFNGKKFRALRKNVRKS